MNLNKTGIKILIHFLFIFFTIISCSREKNNFEVKGSFKGPHPDFIYLSELTNKGIVPVDSAIISKKGAFKLQGYTDFPSFFLLKVAGSRGINMVIEPGNKIKVFINSNNFDTDYIIEGSIESKRIQKLVEEQNKILQKITLLSNEFETIKESQDFNAHKKRLDSIYFAVVDEHKKFSAGFILENTCSFAGLMALYQQLGRKEPVFDIELDFYLFNKVDSCLTSLYPKSEAVKNLNTKVVETREFLKLKPGMAIPEIALKDTTGQVVSLHSQKGKVILFSLSASWCAQCTDHLPLLLSLYKKYRSQGFEIYEVSLDKTMDSWKTGIKENNIPWISVSDLKYWESEPVNLLYIKKVPFYTIIDSNGNIYANDVELSEIDEKLKLLFN